MKINCKVVPLDRMRYQTAGDYFLSIDGTWQFRVAKLNDHRYEQLVLIHELVEALLVQQAGIDLKAIDAFDFAYEHAREAGDPAVCGCNLYDEPGDDEHAPYHREHLAASQAERAAATAMHVDWDQYEQALDALFDDED